MLLTSCSILSSLKFPLPKVGEGGDADGKINITDPIVTLSHLFLNPAQKICKDAADADDSGQLDITDPVFSLSFLFLGGRQPPEPFAMAGLDPTPDELGCDLAQH